VFWLDEPPPSDSSRRPVEPLDRDEARDTRPRGPRCTCPPWGERAPVARGLPHACFGDGRRGGNKLLALLAALPAERRRLFPPLPAPPAPPTAIGLGGGRAAGWSAHTTLRCEALVRRDTTLRRALRRAGTKADWLDARLRADVCDMAARCGGAALCSAPVRPSPGPARDPATAAGMTCHGMNAQPTA